MNQAVASEPVAENRSDGMLKAMVRTAWVAGLFSAVVALLLLVNALRARALDPLDTAKIDEMSLALNRTPDDAQLKSRLRALDLKMRGRFLQSRSFAVSGIYLLLGGVAVCLAALETAASLRKKLPTPDPEALERIWKPGPASRRSVASLGVVLAGFLATVSVLSRHDAEAEYALAAARGPSAGAPQAAGADQPEPAGVQPLPQAGQGGGLSTPPSGQIGPATQPGGSLTPGGTDLTPVNPGGPPKGGGKTPAAPTKAVVEALYPQAWAEAWPGFRGPGGVGLATTKSAPTAWGPAKNVLWKTPISLPGWNSPVVWGDKVFLSGADKDSRKVYCVDANSGKVIWEKPVPSSTKNAPQVQADTGYAPSTMATDGARVFAMFPNGDVIAFDLDGKQVWRRDLGMPSNNYGHAASLVVYGNGLLVQFDQGTSYDDGKSLLLALNVSTGETVWQVKRPVGASWTTPILVKVGSVEQLVTAANPWVIAYNPANGMEIWRAQVLSGDCAPSPTFGAGYVFTANMGATVTALRADLKGDITKSGVGWTGMEDLPDIVSPLCTGDLLYLVTTEGVVTCLDAKTGKKQWAKNYNTRFHASPVYASGRVYVVEDSGKTHILDPGRKFKELGTPSIGEDVRTTPAFVGERIYLRGKANLYCIGAK